MCGCQNQIRESTVSIDSEKGRTIKDISPRKEVFWCRHFEFPAKAHSGKVRAHEHYNFLRVRT